MNQVQIVALCGSLRVPSFNLSALQLAAEGTRSAGASVTVLTGRDLPGEPFDPATAYNNPPDSAAKLVNLCKEAAGFLWASPAYHGTISGLFKNALDYLDLLRNSQAPFLTGKPVGIISVGSGMMAVVNATNTMVFAAHALRAKPLPMLMPIGMADSCFSSGGECHDPLLRQRLLALGTEVARAAIAFKRDQQAE